MKISFLCCCPCFGSAHTTEERQPLHSSQPSQAGRVAKQKTSPWQAFGKRQQSHSSATVALTELTLTAVQVQESRQGLIDIIERCRDVIEMTNEFIDNTQAAHATQPQASRITAMDTADQALAAMLQEADQALTLEKLQAIGIRFLRLQRRVEKISTPIFFPEQHTGSLNLSQ